MYFIAKVANKISYKFFRGTNSGIIIPYYGKDTCYISIEALGYYVYYIIGFLISCNIILITFTLRNIYIAKTSTQTVLSRSTIKEEQSS